MVARAEYDFTAASEEELSLQAGDMLNLAPKGKEHTSVTGSRAALHVTGAFHLNPKPLTTNTEYSAE